jgi:hypothetical protein
VGAADEPASPRGVAAAQPPARSTREGSRGKMAGPPNGPKAGEGCGYGWQRVGFCSGIIIPDPKLYPILLQISIPTKPIGRETVPVPMPIGYPVDMLLYTK